LLKSELINALVIVKKQQGISLPFLFFVKKQLNLSFVTM